MLFTTVSAVEEGLLVLGACCWAPCADSSPGALLGVLLHAPVGGTRLLLTPLSPPALAPLIHSRSPLLRGFLLSFRPWSFVYVPGRVTNSFPVARSAGSLTPCLT